MNSLIKFSPHAIITGVLAGIMMVIDANWPPFVSWVAFGGWSSYFLAGGSPMGGVKVAVCWVLGMLASIAIIELGPLLSALGPAAGPVAVTLIAIVVVMFQKVDFLSTIPFWFIGSAFFFGLCAVHKGDYMAALPQWSISLAVAMVFGYVTVALRGFYTKISGVS